MGEVSAHLWPRLRLISCWADAGASYYIPEVRKLFPQARVQAKGLVATEGVVSFPMEGRGGSILAIRSHFFEFLPAGGDQPRKEGTPTLLAHELEPGARYSVVITTGGGLYRYRLGDLIQVVGHVDSCPLIRFLGKESDVSDRFGEKLNERHVRQALESLLGYYRLRPSFAMVAFEEEAGKSAYTLFIETSTRSDHILGLLGSDLDEALRENYHYRYCRDLGQLGALRVFRIDGNGLETYVSVCRAHGQRAGDIKPVALNLQRSWSESFCGNFLDRAPTSDALASTATGILRT